MNQSYVANLNFLQMSSFMHTMIVLYSYNPPICMSPGKFQVCIHKCFQSLGGIVMDIQIKFQHDVNSPFFRHEVRVDNLHI